MMLLIASPFALAQVNTMEELQQQLAQHPIVRGDFEQKRTLAMFDQPLTSTGQFTLDKTHGLLWRQDVPFTVQLVLTKDKLRQTFADQPAQVITAKDNPMAFYFSHIFLAVFHGDTDQLKQQFDMTFKADNGQWTLALTPKSAPLNAVFDTITLGGKSDLERLTLQEIRGDKTDILFSNQSYQPESLTDAEQAQFKF
ncbi:MULTISPECIES: outer membrane lipoprotein carrier protein LolA [Vibrio]|uniref:Outer membrane lipoprotein carrier protein LolA n=1 Tax=Vibrio mediterranei TaxID=689 RepID=A0ABX5DBY3_9VIBR|nr:MULTISPECIES: outer membrane lipoprotein carrier protein LolA [Vibrio]KFA98739.1 membrane protein [Vibrio sp. ER1A]PCD86305.1 outer membrane lipoprotein carrier protein LolA [Vibrio mediterranei]PRQ66106.1 outer membrane lipoprotein carrier protein LolA [Vibrio mediterranei]